MIQLGVFLVVGGVAGALWRQHHKTKLVSADAEESGLLLPETAETEQGSAVSLSSAKKQAMFDDVGELTHYQRVAWYTLAISAAGAWFYPPVRLISLPLLGYNAYHFMRVVQHSDVSDRKSPMTLFELIGVLGAVATGSLVSGSALLVFAFGSRKLLLKVGNIANNADTSAPLFAKGKRVWVLRDDAEVEMLVSELSENDVVMLRPGELIALEGKVLEGEGHVRQFGLNKKIKMLPKSEGDQVYPFTRLESGSLKISPT